MNNTETIYCGADWLPRVICRARLIVALWALLILPAVSWGQSATEGQRVKEKIIIDTDIGGDIDDAFAVALALQTPEVEILGISTASGDTLARAKILDRMLGESGHEDIPVAVGTPTKLPSEQIGPQWRYGDSRHYARASHPAAVEFILSEINRFPGQITLVTIGPLSNIGLMIDKDITTFRKLKRVVMMGGWLRDVNVAGAGLISPEPETNVVLDISSAQKLLGSGVDIYLMPFDVTINLGLGEIERKTLFYEETPLTDSLALLYLLWGGGSGTPVLFDVMAVGFVTNPELCPVEPLRVSVDAKGMSRIVPGASNVKACLHSDPKTFIEYFMSRMTRNLN